MISRRQGYRTLLRRVSIGSRTCNQRNEQARAALKYSSKKPTRRDARHQADETRKRHNHDMKRKQHTRDETDTTTIESRMWSIQAAVAYLRARSVRTLRDPAKSSCEVSSHLEKMYLVIEHNHQSFEQLGTSSRDIGSRKSEASSSCRGKHNHFEPVE
jgi:hypothetical protein